TTTTCEALFMGVPVVTLTGRVHASRVGASLLHSVGLESCIAADEEAYVRLAAHLASDLDRLSHLRTTLRTQMLESRLCDGPAFAREFEEACRGLWRRWCAAHSG
ncbi:MAG: hypothetical protein KDA21_13880, partial [Phycisphaerales bacterium]|nr:hypothetical protein [Phycisphaerales bacterium]